jgi:uncharacterized protein
VDAEPSGPVAAIARSYRRLRTGDVPRDVALFALLLRAAGVRAPLSAVPLAVRALAAVPMESQADVQAALRSVLTASRPDAAVFDAAFGVFWSADGGPGEDAAPPSGPEDSAPGAPDTEGEAGGGIDQVLATARRGRAELTRRAWYSRSGRSEEPLQVPASTQRTIEELVRRLARSLGASPSRRLRPGERGEVVDLRDSLRRNLGHGEEMLILRRATRVRERERLVVLCDVSSSMRPYAPLFLSLTHSLTKIARGIESAIFNVETSFVTDVFRKRPLDEALAWLGGKSVALAGGTRIGHCVHTFTAGLEARGALRSGTTALILSDGWDVGDADLLEQEMRRLRGQVDRLFWLDPHAAATGYRPQVRGLRIALPFVDEYLDLSGVDSLRLLVQRIELAHRPCSGPGRASFRPDSRRSRTMPLPASSSREAGTEVHDA